MRLRIMTAALLLVAVPALAQWREGVLTMPGTQSPCLAHYDSSANRVFVGGTGSLVTVIDPATNTICAQAEVPRYAFDMCSNPQEGKLYYSAQDLVVILDAATAARRDTVIFEGDGVEMCYDPTNNCVYCTDGYWDEVAVIDGAADTVLTTIDVSEGPHAILYSPLYEKVYSAGDDSLSIISGSTNSVLATVAAGRYVAELCYNTLNGKVYCVGEESTAVIDGAGDSVVGWIPVGRYDEFDVCFNPAGNKLYVTDNWGYCVTVIDASADTVLKILDVPSEPVALRYNPRNNRLYCLTYWDSTVVVIDGSSDTVVASINVPRLPSALCLSTSNNRLFVTSDERSCVSVIDCATNTVVKTIRLRPYPAALCCDTTRNKVYVACESLDYVAVMNCSTFVLTKRIATRASPHAVCWNPTRASVYCALADADSVACIDCTTDSLVATMPVGDRPAVLIHNPLNDRLYCANSNGNSVTVIDCGSNGVVATVPVGVRPVHLGLNTTNNRVYSTNSGGNSVTVIDGATNGVLATLPVGSSPSQTCWNPAMNRAYVANTASHTVTVVNGATNSIVTTIPVDTGPVSLAYNPVNNCVYCADSGAGNVVVIDCSTNMVVTAVAAGESPCLISYVQGSNRAYTLSDRDEMLTVIHCAVNQPFWNGSVEAGPYSTAWNPRYSRLFIAEYGSGLVEIRRDAATDVAVVSITDPHGRYVLGDTVVPIATCRNYGNAPATFMAFMRLYFSSPTPVYVESVSVTGLLPGRDTLVVFGRACTLMQLGWWTARCTTRYSGDLVKANDWQSQSFSVSGPDVGVSQIIAPAGEVDTNSFVTPRATWRAFAGSPTSFKAFAKLFDPARVLVYLDSQAVAGLPVNGETTLVFSRFNVEERYGTWTVRCSTFMPNDSGRANNVLARQFVVKAGGISLVPGWGELEDLPLSPSGKPVKEGGWLAYMDGDECVYAAKGNKTGDFFRYDPLADTWHLLAPIPKGNEGKLPGKGANATTDADRFLYATKGNNTLGFWRYDIERNSWRQLADVPPGISNKKVKGGTDLAYVDFDDTPYVYLLKGYKNEFYRYNVESNAWALLEGAPVGSNVKWDKGSWMVYDEDCALYAHKARFNELWKYDVEETCWTRDTLSGMPRVGRSGRSKKSKDGACAAWLDDEIYALKGGNTQEFWKYDVETNAWTELDTIPSFGSTGKKKKVKSGADITCDGSDCFFALKGSRSREFWRYILPWSVPGCVPEREGVMAATAELGPSSIEILPSLAASGFVNVRYVPPSAGELAVEFYDVSGRLRATFTVAAGRSGTSTLDLRGLAAGVYLVRLTAGGQTYVQKVVLAR